MYAVYMYIQIHTLHMLLCVYIGCMYLLGSIVVLSLLRRYLIYIDLTSIENIYQLAFSCHVSVNINISKSC